MNKTTRMVFIALIVAQALVLHVVEGMIPLPIGVPGARLGLANIFFSWCSLQPSSEVTCRR